MKKSTICAALFIATGLAALIGTGNTFAEKIDVETYEFNDDYPFRSIDCRTDEGLWLEREGNSLKPAAYIDEDGDIMIEAHACFTEDDTPEGRFNGNDSEGIHETRVVKKIDDRWVASDPNELKSISVQFNDNSSNPGEGRVVFEIDSSKLAIGEQYTLDISYIDYAPDSTWEGMPVRFQITRAEGLSIDIKDINATDMKFDLNAYMKENIAEVSYCYEKYDGEENLYSCEDWHKIDVSSGQEYSNEFEIKNLEPGTKYKLAFTSLTESNRGIAGATSFTTLTEEEEATKNAKEMAGKATDEPEKVKNPSTGDNFAYAAAGVIGTAALAGAFVKFGKFGRR
jgi:hypothetical protein